MRAAAHLRGLIICIVGLALSGTCVSAQDATGTLPPASTKGTKNPRPNRDPVNKPPRPPVCNEEGNIILQCGTANCEIALRGQSIGQADSNGEKRFSVPSGNVKLTVSKAGYENRSTEVYVGCGVTKPVSLKPYAAPLQLRVHTNPPNSDVSINQAPQGHSNDEGLLIFKAPPERTLLVVSKPGYLSATQILDLVPQSTPREVAVVLMPNPMKLTIQVPDSIEGVWLRADEQARRYDAREPLQLLPGQHKVTVEALGYTPVAIDVTAVPGGSQSPTVNLMRLSPEVLKIQAEESYKAKRYPDVYTLCKYILEAEPQSGFVHRLLGLSFIAQQDYAQAESHLMKALDGNETFTLMIRRHPSEKFDLQKPHTDCSAMLIFRKSGVEFKGLVQPGDNFQVPYGQIQVKNIQLKYNTVVFLSTSVMITKGKHKEFNFYSYDNELSQIGRPYLELLARLLQRAS